MTSASGLPRPEGVAAMLRNKKARREPIVMVTAYDAVTARAAEVAGVDVVLVGDSAATTLLGLAATRDVTVEEMLMVTRAARRGLVTTPLVGDLPFGSYEDSDQQAVRAARRFVEAGCDAVKMEGAGVVVDRVRAVTAEGIPVVGHVGLLPQQLMPGDRARVHGLTADAASAVFRDARVLEEAGCCAIVFEAVPAPVAGLLVPFVRVPVIGIGAGGATDGQVLVSHDLLGLTEGHTPRFVREYAQLRTTMVQAFRDYADDVRSGRFPDASHTYGIDPTEFEVLSRRLTGLVGGAPDESPRGSNRPVGG